VAGGLGQSFYFQGGTPDTSHQGSLFKITGNYNNAGQAIDGLLLNITNTSSAATSTLANLQVGGVSKFVVDISGNVNVATLTASSLVMSDAGKNLQSVTLGSGLSLSSGTLSVTGSPNANAAWTIGSGLIYNATSTDLVGIGTITPTTTLFVQGKGGTNPFAISSSTGSQLLTVTQAGNVGIGTTTPIALLSLPTGTTAANGINFGDATAKSLFGQAETEEESQTILDTVEPVTFETLNGPKTVLAKLDTGAFRTSLDEKLVRELGLEILDRKIMVKSASGVGTRSVVRARFSLHGRQLSSIATVVDRSHLKYQLIVGRKDLKGFLINPVLPKDMEDVAQEDDDDE
jgi:hypothetical protein